MSSIGISDTHMDNNADTLLNFIREDEGLFPKHLAARFPRILERIDALWRNPDEMRPYFRELMVTARERRQGFPPEVYSEIIALSELYDALNPPPKKAVDDFWNWM